MPFRLICSGAMKGWERQSARSGSVPVGCLPGQDRAPACLAPAVVAERSGRPDHPVAGDDEAQRVGRERPPDRLRRLGLTDLASELAIGDKLTWRQAQQRRPDLDLEVGALEQEPRRTVGVAVEQGRNRAFARLGIGDESALRPFLARRSSASLASPSTKVRPAMPRSVVRTSALPNGVGQRP